MEGYDLADNVTVHMLPDNLDVPLAQAKDTCGSRVAHYYIGSDSQLLQLFAGDGACLLHIAQIAPRRNVQLNYIHSKLGIAEVPDSAKILRLYKGTELTPAEASICVRVTSVLREDYLIPDIEVELADISHGVVVLPEQSGEHVHVHIARSSAILTPLKQVYKDAYEVYGSIVKDFVRNQIYPRIQQHVPSSTRHGVDALRKMLERNRELYRYEEDEFGKLETILGDYLSGNVSMSELIQTTRSTARIQPQTVTREQVGTVETEVPDIVQLPVQQPVGEVDDYAPRPPIMREELSTNMKILETGQKYLQLNNFSMLLGLSDRLMKMNADFFRTPHTTRIIWGGHKVIYIFTEVSGRLSLYYDIELRDPLENTATSGGLFPTTTLITKKRIFVPVPDPLIEAFRITTGAREFYVRFDIIVTDER
jgi:molecular chaperone HtpG